ncbi:MAG: sulfotransferase family protein [Actinomycetes bacterium]
MSLPTFVVAGAQKCGTTTLHRMLRQHPQVFMSRTKELHFFDHHWDEGIDWYSSHFRPHRTYVPPRRRQVHAGESTPTYMYDPQACERMRKTLPDVRVVIILRDPTKRAYSHYWHSRRKGLERVESFEKALEREQARVARDGLRRRARFSYVRRGEYIDQIGALESAYGRDRLHVILLDDLVADHVAVLTSLFGFLGIKTSRARRIGARQANPGRPAMGAAALTASPPGALVTADPGDDDEGEEVDDRQATPMTVYPPMIAETREMLAAYYRPFNDRLAAWLGRDLSHWG